MSATTMPRRPAAVQPSPTGGPAATPPRSGCRTTRGATPDGGAPVLTAGRLVELLQAEPAGRQVRVLVDGKLFTVTRLRRRNVLAHYSAPGRYLELRLSPAW